MPPKPQKGGRPRQDDRNKGQGGGKSAGSNRQPLGGSKAVAKPSAAAASPPTQGVTVPPAAAKKKTLESLPAMPSSTDPNNLSLLGPLELQIRQELLSLDEHLTSIGKVRLMVAKDGACLFRSMAQALFGVQGLHLKVRRTCVEHLLEKEQDYVFFIDIKCDMSDTDEVHKEYLAYTEKLRGETAWGGQLELQALSQCYQRNFMIYQALPLLPGAAKKAETSEPGKKEATHEIVTTEISNGFSETIYLAYSHGNHYDVVFNIDDLRHMSYLQKLVHHSIDTLFQKPSEREPHWLRDLGFERTADDPMTPQQIVDDYDNRQWKLWQGRLQKEKSTDESVARRIIAEESGTADASTWTTVGGTPKKKGTGKKGGHAPATDTLTKAQIDRMTELASQRAAADSDASLAAALHASLEDERKTPNAEEADLEAIRRMEEDERLARELSDEQYALQLSQELNPGSSQPKAQHFPDSSTGGAKVTASKLTSTSASTSGSTSSSSGSTRSGTSSSSSIATKSQSSKSVEDATVEDGFLPAGKKARQAALKKHEQEEREKELAAQQKAKKEQEALRRKNEQKAKEAASAKASSAPSSSPSSSPSAPPVEAPAAPVWSAIASGASAKPNTNSSTPAASSAATTPIASATSASSTSAPTTQTSPTKSTISTPTATSTVPSVSSEPPVSTIAPVPQQAVNTPSISSVPPATSTTTTTANPSSHITSIPITAKAQSEPQQAPESVATVQVAASSHQPHTMDNRNGNRDRRGDGRRNGRNGNGQQENRAPGGVGRGNGRNQKSNAEPTYQKKADPSSAPATATTASSIAAPTTAPTAAVTPSGPVAPNSMPAPGSPLGFVPVTGFSPMAPPTMFNQMPMSHTPPQHFASMPFDPAYGFSPTSSGGGLSTEELSQSPLHVDNRLDQPQQMMPQVHPHWANQPFLPDQNWSPEAYNYMLRYQQYLLWQQQQMGSPQQMHTPSPQPFDPSPQSPQSSQK